MYHGDPMDKNHSPHGSSKVSLLSFVIGEAAPLRVLVQAAPNRVLGQAAPNRVLGQAAPNRVLGQAAPNRVPDQAALYRVPGQAALYRVPGGPLFTSTLDFFTTQWSSVNFSQFYFCHSP